MPATTGNEKGTSSPPYLACLRAKGRSCPDAEPIRHCPTEGLLATVTTAWPGALLSTYRLGEDLANAPSSDALGSITACCEFPALNIAPFAHSCERSGCYLLPLPLTSEPPLTPGPLARHCAAARWTLRCPTSLHRAVPAPVSPREGAESPDSSGQGECHDPCCQATSLSYCDRYRAYGYCPNGGGADDTYSPRFRR